MNAAKKQKKVLWVLKIGSALLTGNNQGLDETAISSWVEQMSDIQKKDIDIILITSGAVAAGMSQLDLNVRPVDRSLIQAAAAIGQVELINAYGKQFNKKNISCAQILLTYDDFINAERNLNIESTLNALISYNIIPIINENDVVSTDSICFGDNDALAAIVANLMRAERLVILTDQHGLFTKNPSKNSNAKLVSQAYADDKSLLQMACEGGRLGKGGMVSKVKAAKIFALSGGVTNIVFGHEEKVLMKIHCNEKIGTTLIPGCDRLLRRQQWLIGHLKTTGAVVLGGCATSNMNFIKNGVSASDIISIEGDFECAEMLRIENAEGVCVGQGLSSFGSPEMLRQVKFFSDSAFYSNGLRGFPVLIRQEDIVSISH